MGGAVKRTTVLVLGGIGIATLGLMWALVGNGERAPAAIVAVLGCAVVLIGVARARRNRRGTAELVDDYDEDDVEDDPWPEGSWPQIIIRRHGRPRRPALIRTSTVGK